MVIKASHHETSLNPDEKTSKQQHVGSQARDYAQRRAGCQLTYPKYLRIPDRHLTPHTAGQLTSAMFPQLNHVQHSRLFVSIRGQNSAFDRRC